jgi:hypothetical protein
MMRKALVLVGAIGPVTACVPPATPGTRGTSTTVAGPTHAADAGKSSIRDDAVFRLG